MAQPATSSNSQLIPRPMLWPPSELLPAGLSSGVQLSGKRMYALLASGSDVRWPMVAWGLARRSFEFLVPEDS